MVPAFVVIGAAVMAKVAASVWFSSRATSPLSQPWREEYLDHLRDEIDIMERKGLATPDEIVRLRESYELLREHVADGWGRKEVFDAASYVSYFRSIKHATTGINGVASLVGSYMEHYLNRAWEAFNTAFPSTYPPYGEDTPPHGEK